MKKTIILAVLALASTVASAQHYGDHHRHNDNRWVGPLILGGIIGYSIRQNQPVQPQQPPVIIYQQAPVFTSPRPIQPAPLLPVYREIIEYDPNCQCHVNVVRQIGWQ